MNASINTAERSPTAARRFEEVGRLSESTKKTADEKPGTPADYSADSRYDRRGAIIKALLKWLECEFFGLFIFLSVLAMRVVMKSAADIIFGLLGFTLYILVMADFGFKEGKKAQIKNSVRGDNVGRGFGVLLGLVSVIPALATLGVLGLSYSGAISPVMPLFKILNAGLWGLINLFCPDMDITHLSPSIFAVYPGIQLLLAAVTAGAFGVGHDNSDLQTKIMYKNKS